MFGRIFLSVSQVIFIILVELNVGEILMLGTFFIFSSQMNISLFWEGFLTKFVISWLLVPIGD